MTTGCLRESPFDAPPAGGHWSGPWSYHRLLAALPAAAWGEAS